MNTQLRDYKFKCFDSGIIMKQVLICIIPIIVSSCSAFDGKIEIRSLIQNDSVSYFFIVNNSKNNIYKFTVKETSYKSTGNKTFRNQFYKLQPGEEAQLGPVFDYSVQKYKIEYTITSYDTLKEVIDNTTQIKISPPKDLGRPPFYINKVQYFKNNKEIDDFYFYLSFKDAKLIDSTVKGNFKTYVYQVPIKSLSKQIPLPRIKTTYKYEITGQVLLKN